jgi:hypothetical protein
MTPERTTSESLFEEYLFSQGINVFEFEKEWGGIPKHPDYTVEHQGDFYLFDVKEFEDQEFIPPIAGGFAVERLNCRTFASF